MSTCMGMQCAHLDKKGQCTFSGVCIVKKYKLNDSASLNEVLGIKKPVKKEETAETDVVFNPFQRGNGCMLAGYTRDEIFAHCR